MWAVIPVDLHSRRYCRNTQVRTYGATSCMLRRGQDDDMYEPTIPRCFKSNLAATVRTTTAGALQQQHAYACMCVQCSPLDTAYTHAFTSYVLISTHNFKPSPRRQTSSLSHGSTININSIVSSTRRKEGRLMMMVLPLLHLQHHRDFKLTTSRRGTL